MVPGQRGFSINTKIKLQVAERRSLFYALGFDDVLKAGSRTQERQNNKDEQATFFFIETKLSPFA